MPLTIRFPTALLIAFAALSTTFAADGPRLPNILFLIADDWSAPHAGAYGDKIVRTPNFDRVAREGVLFNHAFCAAPSCAPSRAAILTGQWPHRLAEAANLAGLFSPRFPIYPDFLENSGYAIGMTGKGWGPGRTQESGWKRNPAGPGFKDFAAFLAERPKDKPFCFWFGSNDPHRNFIIGSGAHARRQSSGNPDIPRNSDTDDILAAVDVPPYLPKTNVVRSDILDYYFEVERFDRDVGKHLELLAAAGEFDNTIVVITADNGWAMPRGKANLYDAGTRLPLAIRWPAGRIRAGRTLDDLVSLTDLAPTFLEAAGLPRPAGMTGRSLLPLLRGESSTHRNRVLVERERHANVREGDLGYPSRGLRTPGFLFIRNFRPDRWPAGDPVTYMQVGPFGDIDWGPTKDHVLANRDDPRTAKFYALAVAKRPAEELYDLKKDPHQLTNLAADPAYAAIRQKLRTELDTWLSETGDPRLHGDDDRFDRYEYFYPQRPGGKLR